METSGLKMAQPHGSSKNLSKNLMQMKFMQRSTLKSEQDLNEQEKQKVIDDDHWVLDIPELKQKESRFTFEPSLAACVGLKYGRFSFKGMNPDVEKLMKYFDTEQELDECEAREKEQSISDEQMTERYDSLVGTITNKFTKKRHRSSTTDDNERTDNKTKTKKKKKFMKPKDD